MNDLHRDLFDVWVERGLSSWKKSMKITWHGFDKRRRGGKAMAKSWKGRIITPHCFLPIIFSLETQGPIDEQYREGTSTSKLGILPHFPPPMLKRNGRITLPSPPFPSQLMLGVLETQTPSPAAWRGINGGLRW